MFTGLSDKSKLSVEECLQLLSEGKADDVAARMRDGGKLSDNLDVCESNGLFRAEKN